MELEKIALLIQPILEKHQVKLYEVVWSKLDNNKVLQIAIMKNDGSMDLDICQSVSEDISQLLDEDETLQQYYLEICSPGAERKLRNLQEVTDAINSYIYVKLLNAKEGMDEVTGTLLAVNNEIVTVEYMNKTRKKSIDIDYQNIKLIRLAVKL